ncbi:Hypothetical predicted protein, partial [Drosophila guanche]
DGQNDKQLELGGQHGQNVALLETPNGITLLGASKLREANGNANGNGTPQERLSVERRPHNDEDDSFEYATDRESSVYNPTTRPLRSVLMSQAGGRNSRNSASSEVEPLNTENSDLLQKGNQLGIPESRFSRWLPKDKLELLEKQAMLLSGRGKAMNAAAPPPATPPKPQKKVLATPTETTATTTTTMATPKLPQETEI